MTALPRWLKHMNRVLVRLQRIGISPKDMGVLTVPGRRTGKPRSIPLTVLELDGNRYLLAGYPGTDWPANARAAGAGTLSIGKRKDKVRLVELDVETARPVLCEWPRRFESGPKMMLDAGVVTDTTPDAFEAIAGTCPVFRVDVV
ncbi:MAG: nitroreductase/quinone reductase family protein [Pseudonocardia sp.]